MPLTSNIPNTLQPCKYNTGNCVFYFAREEIVYNFQNHSKTPKSHFHLTICRNFQIFASKISLELIEFWSHLNSERLSETKKSSIVDIFLHIPTIYISKTKVFKCLSDESFKTNYNIPSEHKISKQRPSNVER